MRTTPQFSRGEHAHRRRCRRRAEEGSHHLHGADVLLLLHVDVSQVQPDVADVRRGLPHLGKHVPSLSEVTLVGQDGTWRWDAPR